MIDYRSKILNIRYLILKKKITYEEGKKLAQPLIIKMNKINKEISIKHNMRYKPFTFSYLIR